MRRNVHCEYDRGWVGEHRLDSARAGVWLTLDLVGDDLDRYHTLWSRMSNVSELT